MTSTDGDSAAACEHVDLRTKKTKIAFNKSDLLGLVANGASSHSLVCHSAGADNFRDGFCGVVASGSYKVVWTICFAPRIIISEARTFVSQLNGIKPHIRRDIICYLFSDLSLYPLICRQTVC